MEKSVITKSVEETRWLGEELARNLTSRLIALYGELGSGKTSFVQGFAKGLGIKERIISPTFTLIRKHQVESKSSNFDFYHVDLYRVENDESLEKQLLELVDDQNIVVVEWAEKFKNLPKERLDIFFKHLRDNRREIIFKSNG